METTKLLADDIVRRMAHRFAQRKGLGEMRAEEIIDHSAPLVWAQRVPYVEPVVTGYHDDARQLLATAVALLCHQRGKKLAYAELIAEREALAQWAARRVPQSVFVGDDGNDAEYVPHDDVENIPHLVKARQAIARLTGYVPLWDLPAYHAG